MKHVLVVFVVLAAVAVLQSIYLKLIMSEARQDHRDIERDGSKNSLKATYHRQSFLRILATSIAMSIPFLYLSWQVALSLLFLEGVEFFILFDRELNRLRGKDPYYVGKTAATDRLFRRVFPSQPEKAMRFVKLGFLAVAVGLFGWFLVKYLTTYF